jgi:ribosome-binding ATPase YchF (GTP1/OBG family)
MKIGFTGIALPEGKVKYNDERMNALVEKDKPKKVSPFYAEFMKDNFVQAESIIVAKDAVLDLLIQDIEKCESRVERCETEEEKLLLQRCISLLEQEKPLCDCSFTEQEKEILRQLAPASFKPVVIVDPGTDANTCIKLALDKAAVIFFYTSGPKETHAWLVNRGSDIVTCAGKIHTDLARGFIKGDVISFDGYMQIHNFNDGKKKGAVKEVDREHIVLDGDIIEIRFNV